MMTLEEKCEFFRLNISWQMRASVGLKGLTKKDKARWDVLEKKYNEQKKLEEEENTRDE